MANNLPLKYINRWLSDYMTERHNDFSILELSDQMKKHFIQVSCWLALLLPIALTGQSNVLDEYVAQALANNLSLRTYNFEEAKQLSRIEQARKLWLPNIDLNASYLFAEGGRTIVFPVGDLFNPVHSTLNRLTASQNFPEDLENFQTQLTPNNYLDAGLSVTKPIINSAIKYNLKIQEALINLSSIEREEQINVIKFQVKQAYLNYLKTVQGIQILDENRTLLEEILAFNNKLIKYNKATPDIISDVLYQLALIDSEINSLGEQQALSRILLNTIMNRNLESGIIIDTTVLHRVQIDGYNLNECIAKALKNRPEFRKLILTHDINDLNKRKIDSQKHPTLNARGAIGLQAEEFSFDDGGPLYTVGLSLGWNLFDGGLRKNRVEELKIVADQNALDTDIAKQQITLEVSQAFYNLRSLYAKLAAEESAIAAAITSYQSIKKKYDNQKVLLIEMLTAHSRLSTSKLNRVLAIIDIEILKADLDRIIYNN